MIYSMKGARSEECSLIYRKHLIRSNTMVLFSNQNKMVLAENFRLTFGESCTKWQTSNWADGKA